MPSLSNIFSQREIFFPNMQTMKAVYVICQDIFVKVFYLDINGVILNVITFLTTSIARLVSLEDKLSNQTRVTTATKFSGILETDDIQNNGTTQSSDLVVGTGTAFSTAGVSITGFMDSPAVKAFTNNTVGINTMFPTRTLDVVDWRTTGNFENGNQYPIGNTWYRPAVAMTTLSSATGYTQAITIDNWTPKKVTISLHQVTVTSSLANAPLLFVSLGNGAGPFTGATTFVAGNFGITYFGGTSTISVGTSTIYAFGPPINRSSSKTISYSGSLTFLHMGTNIWSVKGNFKGLDGVDIYNSRIIGTYVCPSQAITLRITLLQVNATYTLDTNGRISGRVQTTLE